jgi:hypothetical protein
MSTYLSIQGFYDDIDSVVGMLRMEGRTEAADQIHLLLHKVAWTTSSELFGELRDRFRGALKSSPPLPSEIAIRLENFIGVIDATKWFHPGSSSAK